MDFAVPRVYMNSSSKTIQEKNMEILMHCLKPTYKEVEKRSKDDNFPDTQLWRKCYGSTRKLWSIFCITNFLKEPTNDLKDKLPLSLAPTLFLKITCTMRGKMVCYVELYGRRMFQSSFPNSMKAFVEDNL
jgi:hypothetical protein